jgi:hypothetical protein
MPRRGRSREEAMVADRKKVTLPALFAKVAEGTPITWLTCYDYRPPTSRSRPAST